MTKKLSSDFAPISTLGTMKGPETSKCHFMLCECTRGGGTIQRTTVQRVRRWVSVRSIYHSVKIYGVVVLIGGGGDISTYAVVELV